MKKLTMIALVFITGSLFSQENLFEKIKLKLKKEHPELQIENKLIVVNVWSARNNESREANLQVNKAYTAFEFARLKGGAKGMIGVLLCADKATEIEQAAVNKYQTLKPVSLDNSELDIQGLSNIIFDSNGNIVNKNITTDIFEKIHQLITR